MQRHSRQSRLADVGAQGQARIARAAAVVPGHGLEAEVAARYLAGAGVAALRTKDAGAAAAARAVDPGVRVEVEAAVAPEALGAQPDPDVALAGLADPAVRAVASGALLALRVLRAALATEAS